MLYRGPAGKRFDAAIDQVLADQPVKKAKVRTRGEAVKYPVAKLHKKSGVSYSKDVAPILADNCARCHREGGIAPFAMNSYNVIKGFAPMIREVVMTKRMPPGQIDPHIGDFKETYTLTPDETQKLVHWIEAGAQKDGDVDPLTQLKWPASEVGVRRARPDRQGSAADRFQPRACSTTSASSYRSSSIAIVGCAPVSTSPVIVRCCITRSTRSCLPGVPARWIPGRR